MPPVLKLARRPQGDILKKFSEKKISEKKISEKKIKMKKNFQKKIKMIAGFNLKY